MRRRIDRNTELKTALNCLVAYVGVLAFQGEVREFGKWATEHYETQGRVLTAERAALLLDLKALVLGSEAADYDLADLLAQLEAHGWTTAFLRQEIE